MNKLQVEYVKIESLKEYRNNAKLHPTEQIEQIKKSIADYGMNDPIAVWRENEIIEGHGRLLACKQLGIDTVPIIRLDGLTDELNRKCYMAELDPKYVSVIVQRWLNLTGRKDEIFCIRDGQKFTYDEVFGE